MNLIQKYNIPGPRYTSYPTVPFWKNNLSEKDWKMKVSQAFSSSNNDNGISIYIHLPFCESLCTYCGCNTRITKNHNVEQPYLNAVQKEWSMYLALFDSKPRIRELHLGGGTPTFFSPDNLKLFLNAILEKTSFAENAALSFEAHPNNTSLEHLQVLYDVGFRRISLGIQDFDPKVQKIVNRIQSFEQVRQVVEQARGIGYTSINFDLIYGLPFQKPYSVEDTIRKVEVLRPDRIAFYSYAHVPWIKPGQRQFTEMDLPSDDEKRQLYEIGKKMLQAAGYIEIGMDHFSLSSDQLFQAQKTKTLHRNFMGYTEFYTKFLLGLGVSSISDTWNSFSQNVKTVEDYNTMVNANTFPLLRGHMLSKSELILRKHILNIMCNLKTSWKNNEDRSDEVLSGVARLAELEADGLVRLSNDSLEVTSLGKPFLRNICMAFDSYLHQKSRETQIFSSTI